MQVTFSLDLSDWKAFERAVKIPNFMIWMVPVMLVLFQASQILANPRVRLRFEIFGWKALLPQLWMLLGGLGLFALIYSVVLWAQNAQLRKLAMFCEPIALVADEEGISGANSRGRDTIFWPAVHKIIETESHFFVLNAPQGGLIIPKRAFDSPAQCDEFGALLKQKWAQHHLDATPISSP